MTNFSKMAYQSADELMFGRAKVPVTCGYGLEVGTGMVLPEVNFTLPTMKVEHEQLCGNTMIWSAAFCSGWSLLACPAQ